MIATSAFFTLALHQADDAQYLVIRLLMQEREEDAP